MIEIVGIIIAIVIGITLLPMLLRATMVVMIVVPGILIVIAAVVFLQETLLPGLPTWAIWGAINDGFRSLLVAHPGVSGLVALFIWFAACMGCGHLSNRQR